MTRIHPQKDCIELSFKSPVTLAEAGQVALEDYARALMRAEKAETILAAGGGVSGVHVCRSEAGQAPALLRDLEDFALDLARRAEGSGGLGWS
jgi:hypothetical protein